MPGKAPKERERYFIRLDKGEVCEVERDVYLCWYAAERQDRYQRERDIKHGLVSLDEMAERKFEDGRGCVCDLLASSEESIEDQYIQKLLTERLYEALGKLTKGERQLIHDLFFRNIGVREYARQMGVTHHSVQKRRDRILEKMRILMNWD